MAWRVHLTNRAIQQCAILPANPPLLAAWTRRNRVAYFDLLTGAACGEAILPDAPETGHSSEAWQLYAARLTTPDGAAFLPLVRTRHTEIYTTDDGKLRLYRSDRGELLVELEGSASRLEGTAGHEFPAVDLDRTLGTIAALDDTGQLHIWQQDIRIGAFAIGLTPATDLRLHVAVARGGGHIFASDGRRLVLVDSGGHVRKTAEMHYDIGRLACSPEGSMVVTGDTDAGVIRVYHGGTLTPTHQKFAWDLLVAATSLQLLADLPPPGTAIAHLLAYSGGIVTFVIGGVLCTTHLTGMDELPQPRPLL